MSANKTVVLFELLLVFSYGVLLFSGTAVTFHENYYLSLLSMRMGDFETAKSFAEEELKRSPADVDTHLLFVRYYLYHQDGKSARAYLKKALALDGTHKEARGFLKYFPDLPNEK